MHKNSAQIRKYYFAFLCFSYLLFANKILAQDVNINNNNQPTSVELTNPLGTKSILGVINNVLTYLIYISVPFLAFMILYGGFQILFARGSAEKVQTGRQTIMYAAIGFTIILISKGVALILLQVLGAS